MRNCDCPCHDPDDHLCEECCDGGPSVAELVRAAQEALDATEEQLRASVELPEVPDAVNDRQHDALVFLAEALKPFTRAASDADPSAG